ncbi:MAG: hypothetical protein HZA22_08300 [Nitrospirae bacterium]|nr:hypothetical protein [Nitrospirota bacterium]MBI5696654.1 hypothetical protein [Nitrospirota bacterium]
MKKKSLIETNPYLKDPKALQEAITRHAVSSFAIEGIHVRQATAAPAKPATRLATVSKKP